MYKLNRLRTLLLAFSSVTGVAYAVPTFYSSEINIVQQATSCTGIVKDLKGETIIGASIVVKGTSNGTITDINGHFNLSKVKEGDIIQISFVGFITQDIKWSGEPLNIILKEDTKALDEVVVVGYGVQKKGILPEQFHL